MQRVSHRLFLIITASLRSTTRFSRDITSAFIPSHYGLNRDVIITPLTQFNLQPEMILKFVRPLYGVLESGLHCYFAYLQHNDSRLNMQRTTSDPCFLLRSYPHELECTAVLQVDGSPVLKLRDFQRAGKQSAAQFKFKPR